MGCCRPTLHAHARKSRCLGPFSRKNAALGKRPTSRGAHPKYIFLQGRTSQVHPHILLRVGLQSFCIFLKEKMGLLEKKGWERDAAGRVYTYTQGTAGTFGRSQEKSTLGLRCTSFQGCTSQVHLFAGSHLLRVGVTYLLIFFKK